MSEYFTQDNSDSPYALTILKPNRTITFTNGEGKSAAIDFEGPSVTYSGDMPVEESARIFFAYTRSFFG